MPSRRAMRMRTSCLLVALASAASCTSTSTPDASSGLQCGSGTECSGTCRDLTNDSKNCGSCGAVCGAGEVCANGVCALSCGGGTTRCGAACSDLRADPSNCGACGAACAPGLACAAGVCSLTCPGTSIKCGASCADPSVDRLNCGGCGLACGSGLACVAGSCQLSCPAGLVTCNGTCVDPLRDGQYCGATAGCGTSDAGVAGVPCSAGQVCSGGACGLTCGGGATKCGASCVDTLVDRSNCGGCGTVCAQGLVCAAGSCQLSCPSSLVNCNGACVDAQRDNRYCGATLGCGVADAGLPGVTCSAGEVCSSGGCALSCGAGTTKCGASCVDPLVDRANCGGCGVACAPGLACVTGACLLTCPVGFINCNGSCIDPQRDNQFCGATFGCGGSDGGVAGTACSPGQVCSNRSCGLTCSGGTTQCGSSCVDPLVDRSNCGGCGMACALGLACVTGNCTLSCPGSLINCNGACIDPLRDTRYCGATVGCGAMAGDAGAICASGQACSTGMCGLSCPSPLIVCSNACVDPKSDPANCGGCGTVCSGVANGAPTCNSGTCAVTCSSGTTPCAAVCGGSGTVCVNTVSDAQNCGACGVQCAGWSCQTGLCRDPSNGTLAGMITTPRSDWLFYVRDNGVGAPLTAAAASFGLGATTLAGVGGSVREIAEWDYSCLRIPNGSTDGSGLPRSTFPCFDALQGCTAPATDAVAISRLQAYYVARRAALPATARIISATGHFFFQHYGAEWGADLIQSEVGENINSTQTQIAFCRGAAKQFGKPWGLDMSSWYGPGNRDWNSPGIWGSSSCPTCGHSLSLTQRTYLAAYMSGADFMEDEGGSYNFFLNRTAPLYLSPLGQVAQTANQFANQYVNRGTPFVPMAILMEHDHGMGLGWFEATTSWDTFPLDASRLFTRALYLAIWPQSFNVGWSTPGANESQYMVPSPFGDSFDVLLETAPASLISGYRAIFATGDLANNATLIASLASYVGAGGIVVLDSTPPAAPYLAGIVGGTPEQALGTLTLSQASQYPVGGGFVVVIKDKAQWSHVLSIVSGAVSPFKVTGNAEYLFNQRGSSWVLTVLNDLGVTKVPLTQELTSSALVQTLTVQAKVGNVTHVVPWRGTPVTQIQSNQFSVTVAAGEVGVYQFDGSCLPSASLGALLTEP